MLQKQIFFISIAILFSLWTGTASAHEENQKQSSISAAAHLNFSNKNVVDRGKVWQVPGTLMGGEAFPVEKGLALQDLQLEGIWFKNDELAIFSRLSTHDSNNIELENFGFNYFFNQALQLTLGKIDARFSPSISWHAHQSHFNEAPLNAEVLFGGHFIDTGLSGSARLGKFTFGAEAWNGDNWPASPDRYAGDLFAHYSGSNNHLRFKTGLWLYYSEAERLQDTRYSGSHNHGATTPETISNFYFSGDNQLGGMFLELTWLINNKQSLGFYSEGFARKTDGLVEDESRSSLLESDYQGYLSELYFSHQNMTFALRHEAISVENIFSGSGASFIAGDAGLVNNDFEPSRSHFSVTRTINAFSFRLEAVRDQTWSDDFIRYSAGLIWQDKLWQDKQPASG